MRRVDRLGGWRNGARWWVALTCLAAVLTSVATGSADVNGLVVGKVVKCIGPLKVCPTQRNALVKAFDARHHLVAAEQITNGHFSFALKPGRYSLTADAANERWPARRKVRINANQTKLTTLVFHIEDSRPR